MSNLFSSMICRTIAATSSLVAVDMLPDDVLELPDASGIMLAQTACGCGGPSLHGWPRYQVIQTADV